VSVVRNERNLGVARGRHVGARQGSAPYICFLDSDARLEPDCLRLLIDAVDVDEVGLAVPVFSGQLPTGSAGRAPTLARKVARALGLTARYRGRAPISAPSWSVDFGIGACQVFRREAYDAVGGLDDSIFYGPEDVDFCLRLAAAGWGSVQVRDARCEHPPRRRNRMLLTRRGLAHTVAVSKHLWRHRRGVGRSAA
jgi:N-acetylglucosaminyl-diphospho-decaprenol L-rhamnosyltransferase